MSNLDSPPAELVVYFFKLLSGFKLIKILYVAKNIPLPGFNENKIIIEQKKMFDDSNVEVDLIYPKEFMPSSFSFLGGRFLANSKIKNNFDIEGVNISVFNYFRLPFIKSIEWLLCFLLTSKIKFNYDLVHAHYIFPDGIIAFRLSRKYKIPFVVTVRNGDLINVKKSIINKFIFKFILKRANKVIALTNVLENKLLKVIPKEKVMIIPNFIENDFYYVKESVVKRNLPKIRLICIANLIPRKNINWLVEYASIKRTYVDLTICGDGELKTKLQSIATDNVHFKGILTKKNIINELDNSDILVLPSLNETFGLVYVEAASRKNIIVGLSGTGLDGIDNEGFYFVKDKKDLFACLDKLLVLGKDELNRQQGEAFLCSESFKKLNVKKQLEKLYYELCS